MVIPERIQWIQLHKRRGDIKAISEELSMKANTVKDIIAGRFYGTKGSDVLRIIEERIENRLQNEKVMRKRYNKKLSTQL